VNGVNFAGTLPTVGALSTATADGNLSMTISGPSFNSSTSATGTGAYGSTAAPYSSLSTSYKGILAGGAWDSVGGHFFTVTMNNLTVGHEYALQDWELDSRKKGLRYANINSPGGNTVKVFYSLTGNAGGTGQYSIGTFAAASSSQPFMINGKLDPSGGNTQINAMQLRDVTGVWSGSTSGNWDNTSTNFTGNQSFSSVAGLVTSVYFADTDGAGNAVANDAITIQPGGVSIGTAIFQNNAVNYTVTGSDSTGLTGTGGLLKTGTGQLTLQGSNTFSGGINVSAGTLTGSVPAAFGTGNLTINPTGTAGTSADAATVYSNGSISPAASVVVNTNSATAIGSLILQDASPAIAALSGNGTVQLGNSSGTVLTIGGTNASSAFTGTITDNGAGSLVKAGTGNFNLSGSNTYTGSTNVSAGTLTVTSINALPATTTLSVAQGATLVISNGSAPIAVTVANISGGGVVQLNNNALVVHAGSLSAVSTMVAAGYNNGGWNGSAGIVSSTASSDTTFLTAIGTIVNDDGSGHPLYGTNGSIRGTFDAATPAEGDVLVKYTYYGDANLDGQVDSSDYSRIDAGFVSQLTGWGNGDFNYDGAVNGSDYTLIDNAFSTQGGSLAAEIAGPAASATAQIANTGGASAVPEPTAFTLLGIGTVGLLGRRRRNCC
jgi:autotransporter-associated beta strand protein